MAEVEAMSEFKEGLAMLRNNYANKALVHFTKAIALPAGTGIETRSEQQVELMRTFGATVIVGFVDYIKRLAQVARDKGIEPGRDIKIRMISGHVGREDRGGISAAWGGAMVYDWYGVADTGIIAAENMQFNTKDETTRLQEADIAQISIDLSRREVLYQMSLSVAGKLMSTSLLDFIR